MSARLTALDPSAQSLLNDGFAVEVRQQHLLMHDVPYVNEARELRRGTLICTYVWSGDTLQPQDNHQVWFAGSHPCSPAGAKLTALALPNQFARVELFPGQWVDNQFSNKPDGVTAFSDHGTKLRHYADILTSQARGVDPKADARTHRIVQTAEGTSPFKYDDAASALSNTLAISDKLALKRVAIIGLGGTGSYVLDQVAKTPVGEIHLFDGDRFLQHNAFRAPGAPSYDELLERKFKTDYFKMRYDPMRWGLHSHPYLIEAANLGELAGFDFVFVCVDKGPARRLICDYLIDQKVPFVDVGMSVEIVEGGTTLIGTCRATLCTPEQNAHLASCAPFMDDQEEGVYRKKIQVADLNAINAMMAVIKWKQLFGFYHDDFQAHQGTYSVSSQSMTRSHMMVPKP